MPNNDIVPGFDEEKDESLRIRLEQVPGADGVLILWLSGYIDTFNSNFFGKRVQRAIEAGYTRLIFHCGGLNYVSSTGIGSFTAFLKSVRPRGGNIVLLEIQPKVYEVFQLLGFAQFFTIRDNLDEAKEFFTRETQASESDIFPRVFKCPICGTRLRAAKAGRYRCANCRTILAINATGEVFLG